MLMRISRGLWRCCGESNQTGEQRVRTFAKGRWIAISIYANMVFFDGEPDVEGDNRQPIAYQQNTYPLDETKRDGLFEMSYIPSHIADGPEDDRWPAPVKPYLRVGMAARLVDGMIVDARDDVTVMLDRGQVEEVRDALTWWLDNAEGR